MLDMSRYRPTPPSLADPPQWLAALDGYDMFRIRHQDNGGWTAWPDGIDEHTEYPGGTWRVSVALPVDLSLTQGAVDPLVLLVVLADASASIENKIQDLVALLPHRRQVMDPDRPGARYDQTVCMGEVLRRGLTPRESLRALQRRAHTRSTAISRAIREARVVWSAAGMSRYPFSCTRAAYSWSLCGTPGGRGATCQWTCVDGCRARGDRAVRSRPLRHHFRDDALGAGVRRIRLQ